MEKDFQQMLSCTGNLFDENWTIGIFFWETFFEKVICM